MRILILHTYYQIGGGEDAVFEQEVELLRNTNEVAVVTFRNKAGIFGALQFLISPWNFFAAARFRKRIKKFSPDIIHIHNLHFAIGPVAIRVANRLGIPVVQTLHNYRLICPSAILQHNGEIFTDSVYSDFPWKAIQKGVYHQSTVQTFFLALSNFFHRKIGTWNKVSTYIVLTSFAKKIFAESVLRIPEEKFIVKANFFNSTSSITASRKSHFLFVGRLMQEKGVLELLNAFSDSKFVIKIAGSGPLLDVVLEASSKFDNIVYLGNLKKHEVLKEMTQCSALIFPSIWYEGMPMTIIEAQSLSTPIIAANLGAMTSMIEHEKNGLLYHHENSSKLKDAIAFWFQLSDADKQNYQRNAKSAYFEHYTPIANLERLTNIYSDLLK